MGGLYRLCEWIMRLAAINLLWVVCSFPIFFLGLLALVDVRNFLPSLFLAAIISPFLLFPATAAMFTVARKWVMGEADVPLFKTFFRGYRENYLQSMIGGIVFTLLGVILYTNFRFYLNQQGGLHWLAFLFITLGVILSAACFNFFSIMVHFHMKIGQIIKNAILISIGNPISSVSTLVTNGVIFYVSLAKFTFLIPFFMGSLMATATFWYFYRIYQRMQQKQEELLAKESSGTHGEPEPSESKDSPARTDNGDGQGEQQV